MYFKMYTLSNVLVKPNECAISIDLVQNKTDLIRCDNTTGVQHINTQWGGGRISTSLFSDVVYLELSNRWQCLSESSSYCRVKKYSSRSLEPSPDSTNRLDLNISILQNFFFQIFGHPLIDMFAFNCNRETQIFCTWSSPHQAYALNALSVSWEVTFLYAYPLICLIPKVLHETI